MVERSKVEQLMMIRKQAYLGRVEWASRLLDEVKPEGTVIGVEVGLWKADFAQLMLRKNPRLYWYGVDPYAPYGRMKRKQPEWDAIYGRVMKKMEEFGERFISIRERSEDGVHLVPRSHFTFIDGNHDPDYVYGDLKGYEKRVKKGGILAGHDYFPERCKPAVDEYVKDHQRDMQFDNSFDPCGVFWWTVK